MKKTIFISSTFVDLATHRKSVWGLLEEFDVAIRGMEQFGARKETPLDTCIAEVEQSDIYVGIIAFRLGSVEKSSGKSYTQLEYERAQELSKETLIYLVDEENARFAVKYIDRGTAQEKLDAFKKTLRERHTVDSFVSEEDLVEKLRRDLRRYLLPTNLSVNELDEFSETLNVVNRFVLVPKHVAGREVRLQVQFIGSPYPASNEICSAFNYEFGSTIGIPVKIVKPGEIGEYGLSELYLSGKQVDDFLPAKKDEIRDIYAKLEFANTPIQKNRTRYKDESYTAMSEELLRTLHPLGSLGARINQPAEAKLILAFTKSVVLTPTS